MDPRARRTLLCCRTGAVEDSRSASIFRSVVLYLLIIGVVVSWGSGALLRLLRGFILHQYSLNLHLEERLLGASIWNLRHAAWPSLLQNGHRTSHHTQTTYPQTEVTVCAESPVLLPFWKITRYWFGVCWYIRSYRLARPVATLNLDKAAGRVQQQALMVLHARESQDGAEPEQSLAWRANSFR